MSATIKSLPASLSAAFGGSSWNYYEESLQTALRKFRAGDTTTVTPGRHSAGSW